MIFKKAEQEIDMWETLNQCSADTVENQCANQWQQRKLHGSVSKLSMKVE